ncbi:MAG TPA: CidA/LrgA family protein [Burkholderiaceae bacterium]|nr:CidA/LrgA family protein [Burkholderiaceae bacterium]
MIEALTFLLGFQLAGETIVALLRLPLPGPVLGLALLAATLLAWPSLLARLRPTALTLAQHLSLLFVPAGVGVMVHAQRLSDEGFAIVAAIVISTVLAIGVTALTVNALMRRATKKDDA